MSKLLLTICLTLMLNNTYAQVVLYATHSCDWCLALTYKFKEAHIQYKEVFVDDNSEARKFLKDLGLNSVPQVFDDGKLVGGYDATTTWIKNHH